MKKLNTKKIKITKSIQRHSLNNFLWALGFNRENNLVKSIDKIRVRKFLNCYISNKTQGQYGKEGE